MKWSRRELFTSLAAVGLGVPLVARAASTSAKNVVVVWANGGWDSTFCVDPKLGVATIDGPDIDSLGGIDTEEVATYGEDLRVVVNPGRRPAVGDFFQKWGERVSVVNGVHTGSVAHDPSRLRLLTGSGVPGRPDISVIAGSINGADLPLGSIDLSGYSLLGPLGATGGRIGRSSQLKALVDPKSAFQASSSVGREYPLFVPDGADQAAVAEVVQARLERLAARRGGTVENDQKLSDLFESLDRAQRLSKDGAEILSDLQLGSPPGFIASMPLAVRLLQQKVCSTVFIDTASIWDTHTNNQTQHGLHDNLFFGLTALADSLDEAGMLDSTVVMVLSEMTRTPIINAERGKDHWPFASALLFGGGVRGGRSFAGTNDALEGQPVDFETGKLSSNGQVLEYDAFAASLLDLVGVDPKPWFGDLPLFTAWKA